MRSAKVYLLRDLFYGRHSGDVKMAAASLVVDEHAVLHASLNGLLGRLHDLYERNVRKE